MFALLRNGGLTISLKGADAAPSDETRIKNPTSYPIWLHGIRFALTTSEAAALSGIGGAIGVKMNLGQTPLMQNYVPLWLLRTQTTDTERTPYDQNLMSSPPFTFRYTWMFRKPLLMLPGQYLSPLFNYPGMLKGTDPATVDIQMTMLADIAEHVPEMVSVPWACSFSAQSTVAGTAALALPESRRTDIFNPHDFPLHIDRLTGRILINQQDGDDEYASTGNSTYPSANTNVRMFREDGTALIRDPVAFAHAFSQPLKAWRMEGCVMPPRSYYQAVIDVDYSDATAYGAASVIQPQIGLLGYRDIPLAQLGKG